MSDTYSDPFTAELARRAPPADTPDTGGNPFQAELDKRAGPSTPPPIRSAEDRGLNPMLPSYTPGTMGITGPDTRASYEKYLTQRTADVAAYAKAQGTEYSSEAQPLDFGTRFRIGRQLERGTITDARKVLQDKLGPDANLLQWDVPGHGPVTLYRANGDQPYRDLGDPYELTDPAKLGSAVNVKNIAGLGAGAAAAIYGAPIIGGAALVGGATAAGDLADKGIDVATGDEQKSSFQSALLNAAKEGAFTGVGAAGLGYGQKAVGALAQAYKIIKADPAARDQLVQFAKEELVSPSIGQMAANPLIRMMARQTAGTSNVLDLLSVEQKNSLQSAIESKIAQSGFDGVSTDALQVYSNLKKQSMMEPVAKLASMDRSDATAALQQSYQGWLGASSAAEQAAERDVQNQFLTQNGSFDTAPIRKEAYLISRNVVSAGYQRNPDAPLYLKPIDVPVSGPTPQIQPILQDIWNLGKSLSNKAQPAPGLVGIGPDVPPQADAFQQVTALREKLVTLMNSGDAQTSEQAFRLYDKLQGVMQSPRGVTAETKAAMLNYEKMSTDNDATRQLFKRMQDDPSGNIASKLVQPGQYNRLSSLFTALESSGDTDGISAVKEGFKSDLLSDPGKINAKLDRFTGVGTGFSSDTKTLRLVLGQDEEDLLRSVGNTYKRWNSTETQKLLNDSPQGPMANALKLSQEGSQNELDTLVKLGGTKAQESLRAGVYQYVRGDTAPDELGRTLIDPKGVAERISSVLSPANLERLGTILSPEDINRLKTWQSYAGVVGQGSGPGAAGLQAAATAAKSHFWLAYLTHPESQALSIAKVVNNDWVARMLAKPASAGLVDKAIEEGPTKIGMKALVAASASAYADLHKDVQE